MGMEQRATDRVEKPENIEKHTAGNIANLS